jgi:hypothetical protein
MTIPSTVDHETHRCHDDDRLVSPAFCCFRAGTGEPPGQLPELRFRCWIAADSLERDLTGSRHSPVVHAKGNVVVRLRVSDAPDGTASFMMLYADAVTYREDTGEIQPSGKVRITFHKSEPQLAAR